MTKSIEEQADRYVKKNNITDTDDGLEKTLSRLAYIAGAKARDVQWSAVVNELKNALKKIVKHDKTECPIIGHGTKYEHCSICVADSALDKADQMLKEMGVK